MSIISGYSATLPANVLLGSMVIYVDGGPAVYGATQDEPSVTIPHTYDNLKFDGSLGVPIVGLDRRINDVPSIEGTFIELTDTKSLDLEPGGASATVSSVATITPGVYGDFLAATAPPYKRNVVAAVRRGGGGISAILFPWALMLVDTIAGQSAANGTVKLKIEARQDAAAASLGVAPYQIVSVDTAAHFATWLATLVV